MTTSRRRVLASFSTGLLLCMSSTTHAQEYPNKPITLVVGYSAGGPVDTLTRALAQRLSEDWKQQIIVDNRPGANEAIAASQVSKSAPDGYTYFVCTESPLTQNQHLYKHLTYHPEKDFSAVTHLVSVPMALVVPVALPVNSLQEFLALVKERASSGKPLNYGSAGMGGVTHLPMAMLAKRSATEMTHVPYKGAAPLLPDLVAGQVDAAFLAVSAVAPFVRDGKLKALVVSAPSRTKALQSVPVFGETGVQDVQASFIMGVVAPAGTPSAHAQKFASAAAKVLAESAFREKYLDPFGYVPMGNKPAEFEAYLAKDRIAQAERIRVSGAQLD